MVATHSIESVAPLFVKDNDIGENVTPIQVCDAIVNVISDTKLEGVQKVNNLWRIYLKDKKTRLKLSETEKIVINGQQVKLYDRNPFLTFNGMRHLQQINSDKLTIKYLPLSVSNMEIQKLLKNNNIKPLSSIKYGLIRDANGQLTSYKSGDRYLYVEPFSPTLPRQQKIGTFKCLLIHHGKDVICKACNLPGHKIGSDSCIAKPKDVILAFKGYQHPLSNHFPCELEIYDKTFKSAEYAYFYYMACEMGRTELAEEIQEAVHAGKVKHLSKGIADDTERWQWERENTDVMKEILEVKADQCEQFRQCLLENCDTVLAEATPSKIWASGLSPWATEHTILTLATGQARTCLELCLWRSRLSSQLSSLVKTLVNLCR